MTKQVGLRFIFVGGGFLQVAVSEGDAKETVRAFLAGEFRDGFFGTVGGAGPPLHAWGVQGNHVAAVHTVSPEAPPAQVQQYQPLQGQVGWRGGSGL
jgi:hypothetical protein